MSEPRPATRSGSLLEAGPRLNLVYHWHEHEYEKHYDLVSSVNTTLLNWCVFEAGALAVIGHVKEIPSP